jgi:uncharacterized protein YbaP (TraB family)
MNFCSWRGVLAAMATLLAATVAVAQQPAAACPPAPQPPTAEQVQAAQQRARDRGFLWHVQRDGRSAWLFGTIHLGRPMWLFHGPQVRQALAASDTLALEIDVSDTAALMQAAAATPAAAPLPAALRQRLERQAVVACLPAQLMAQQHPILQLTTLAIMAARWDGLDAAYGQELLLTAHARAARLPVVALETPARQMQALIPPAGTPLEGLITRGLDQLEQGVMRRITARLVAAWERGDLAELEDYERWCECVASAEERALMRRLNDERNPAMAERIDALHRDGKRVFVAVGALHMTGPQGLPKLLRERGYSVERVAFAP